MPSVWIHVGLPIFLWIVIYLSEARALRGDEQQAENQFRRGLIRQLEAIEDDRLRIVGKVVSADGGSVNLGTSVEQPESISGTPVLQGAPILIESNDGRRFRLRPGTIHIERLPGAERKLVRTVTTDDGVEQTYSFELPDGFELMVMGKASDSTEGAFREGAIDLAPLDDGYRIGEKLIDGRKTPTRRQVDTTKNMSILGAFFALASIGFGYIPFLGPFLWFPAMAIMAVTGFLLLFGSSAVEPLRADEEAKLEALEVHVEVPLEEVQEQEPQKEEAEAIAEAGA